MPPLTKAVIKAMLTPLSSRAGGFDRSYGKGAEAVHRKVRGFFYALHVTVGGVGGSRKACRTLCPVDQPLTPSATQGLIAPAGGKLTAAKEQSQ
jgi:hypothetical protein